MKKPTVLALTSLALLLTVAADAPADDATYVTARGPRVLGLQLAKTSYAGGPVPLELLVQNANKTALAQQAFTFYAPASGLQSKTVDLPPGVTKVPFVDPSGSLCNVKDYAAALGAGLAAVDNVKLRVTPSCSFGTKLEDPWMQMTDDAVDHQMKTKIYVSGVKVVGAPSCASPLTVSVEVTNHSPAAAQGMAVTLFDASFTAVGGAAALAVPKDGRATVSISAKSMVTGAVRVRLAGTNPHITDRGSRIHVTPTCTLSEKKL